MRRLPEEEVLSATLKARLAGKALLLTGASGFVGKAVLAQLAARAAGHAGARVLLRGDAARRACATRC